MAVQLPLAMQIKLAKLPAPEPEYRFAPPRRWRFDLAWPTRKIAVEIEGGVYTQGRHVRGKGFEGDVRKYNQAAKMGWQLFRFTTSMVRSGEALRFLGEVFS